MGELGRTGRAPLPYVGKKSAAMANTRRCKESRFPLPSDGRVQTNAAVEFLFAYYT